MASGNVETTTRIEPTLLEAPTGAISDVLAQVAARSALLGRALHPQTAASLASVVRLMNTYYSNLIEGHNTRPRDIERAWPATSILMQAGAIYRSRPGHMFVFKRGLMSSFSTERYYLQHRNDSDMKEKIKNIEGGQTLQPYNETLLPDKINNDFCVPSLALQQQHINNVIAGKQKPGDLPRIKSCGH